MLLEVAQNYRQRSGRLGLYSLECRTLKGDLIDMYKIMGGTDRVNVQSFSQSRGIGFPGYALEDTGLS